MILSCFGEFGISCKLLEWLMFKPSDANYPIRPVLPREFHPKNVESSRKEARNFSKSTIESRNYPPGILKSGL
jgi:hypothetical protein